MVALAVAAGIATAAGIDPVGPAIAAPLGWAVAALAVATLAIAALRARRGRRTRPRDQPGDRADPAVGRWRRAAVLVAGVALGTARGARPPLTVPAGAIADDRIADRVIGVVRGPIAHGPRGDAAVLDPGGPAIWLWTEQSLRPGERVAATGALHRPRGLRDPAIVDRELAVRARGAALELTAHSIERLGDASGLVDRAWRWADATQARWSRAIQGAGGDPAGSAALRGIALGDRRGVPDELDQRWRAIGIFHVLSVSGLHLAVVAGLAFQLLRRLVAASPWGNRTRPARWAAPPAIALAIGYTLITGAQLATLRALIAVVLALIAQALDRPLRLCDAIGLAALAILLWRPADLFDPSFQLSFAAALTLALRPPGEPGGGVRGWAIRGIATSAWVALTTAPITAYHFHQVAAGGIVGNLVLTPVVELIALPLGLAGAVLGIAPAIAAASWIVGLADRGAGLLGPVTPVGHVAVASAARMAILAGVSLAIATRARWSGSPGAPGRFAAPLAWLALCLGWWLARTPAPAGALRVTFLDVGQGDAALIELPDGAIWLVDAGGNPGARDPAQAAAPGRAIDRVLAGYDHTRIDLAIVSHPHPDHYLGLLGITAPIAELWSAEDTDPAPDPSGPGEASQPGQPGDRGDRGDRGAPRSRPGLPRFTEVAAQLAQRGTRLVHPPLGIARRTAGVDLVVWAPRYQVTADAAPRCAADPVRTVNDNSLVVALSYRGRTILFAGDVEAEAEAELVAAGLGPVDVVKVAHHGSPTSSTSGFIAATRPRLAVISCGAGNAFGFPSPGVVERWRAAGAELARTDRDGAIAVTIPAAIAGEAVLAIDRFAP